MKLSLCAAAALSLGLLCAPALAQTEFPARLAGHAILPALTLVPAPAGAPADLQVSGKFTTGQRVEAIGSIEGRSGGRPTGVQVPFRGQPMQGHSGILRNADGSFWLLTDNGAGNRANSPDFMLHLSRYRINFQTNRWDRLETVFLHDPDRRVPFRIIHEGTPQRFLTGSDFDPEGVQIAGGHFWIGDEFGPFLIKVDMQGRVRGVFETQVDGRTVISPDHPSVRTPAIPGGEVAFQVRRSRGFEGLAASPDGSRLFAMLEGPLWDASTRAFEQRDGRAFLRVLEFDVQTERWTGRQWRYTLEGENHAIGDFNMIDATTALVIERDSGEGTADRACPAGQRRTDCFHDIARFKRVYKIEMSEANVNDAVRKIGFIDLMRIQDPNRLARVPLNDGVLTFPFFTIENVDVVDARHIVVGNDNNLPFSSSRHPNRADDNELVLLEVSELLAAR
ncbi:MAG: esterase-like activity of phytase family protein [Serpentinimonas sp.]|nr:esterase-like activity of phytase family protein [Serpentinimonas sp.]